MTDRDFEKYLEGDSSLSRAYRASATDSPPVSIDKAVRDALAAEHAETAVQRSRFHEWHRVLVPMAAAATVLLSFSLVMQLVLDPTGEGMRMDDTIAMSGRSAKKVASAEEFVVADAPTESIDAFSDSVVQADTEQPSVSAAPAPSADTPVVESAGDVADAADAADAVKARVGDDAYAAAPPRMETETAISESAATAETDFQSNTAELSDDAYAPEPPVLASRDEPDAEIDVADMAETDAAKDAAKDTKIARDQRDAMAKTEPEARARVSSEGDVIGDALDAGEPAIVAGNRGDDLIDGGVQQTGPSTSEATQAPSAGGLAMESAPAPVGEAAESLPKPQLTARRKICEFERDGRLVRARSVESRIEVARDLVELACTNQARDVIRALIDDEPDFDISGYPDLVELMEAEY